MSTQAQEDVAAVMNAHLKQFANFQTIKRVFSAWKCFHVETKQRIAKIITAMDFHEQHLQTYYFNVWIVFIKAAKEEKASTFREILLARRVARKWQELIQRNNKILLKKIFGTLKDYLRRERIGREISLGYNRRLLSGCIWRMKEYSIWRFERETRLHEKSVLMHKRNLKYRFFQLLKSSAKITRDVEFMRSTALESRRFFLFKRFFDSWKAFAKTNKLSRISALILSRKTQNSQKKFALYSWIQASVVAYQVRCFNQRNLIQKSFKALAGYARKKAARNKQVEYAVKKRIMSLKKMILLQWNYYANHKQTSLKRCEAYCQKRKTLKLEKAFAAFKKVCFKSLSEQRLMYLAMKHHQMKILGACFGSWAGYLEQNQKEYLNMLTAERHNTKMLQRLYFKTLKSYILHRKRLKASGTVIKLNVEEKRKAKAFGEFKRAWENELQIFNKAAWINKIKVQGSTFNAWRNFARRSAYRKNCIKWSTDRHNAALLLSIVAAWARRSNQRRLIRYQNKDAKMFQRQLQQRKGFLKLRKNWLQAKNAKIIAARREMRVCKTAFSIWVQEKNSQELVTRHIIERMLSKQCMAFFWLKGQAMKKKQYRECIARMNFKREERMKQITWRIWQLFLRIKGEKELYRLSLLKYWLTKKAKGMLKNWSQFTEKRKNEKMLAAKIAGKRAVFQKKWLLRELKEQSAEKLLMLRRTQRLRKRWDFKRSRVFFVAWAMKAEQNRTVRNLVRFSLEQRAWRRAQNVLIEWTLIAQKNKRNRLKVEEHTSFKDCVKISLILKSWRRLARILAKEHKKTKRIADNCKYSMLRDSFVGWSEAYRDKRFHEQNAKAEEFLMKRLAFMRVAFQLRQFSERSQKKRRIESQAMAHLINKQYEHGWAALSMNLISQKRKKSLLAMSQIVEKALLFRRIIARMKVSSVLEKVKKVTCKFAAERLLRKSFKSLQDNWKEASARERKVEKFREIRQKQIKLLVLQALQENLDRQIVFRGRSKQLMKKKQFRMKEQCFAQLRRETMKYRRVRLIQKELNRNKLARVFHAMKDRKTQVALKVAQCSLADQQFKQCRLRSILKHWNIAIHEDKMDILTSNTAFRNQVRCLLAKAFKGLQDNQAHRASKESNMVKAITARCSNLKACVFKAMRVVHLETLKVNLIRKKANSSTQLVCLKRWQKQLHKQTHAMPAILTINRVCRRVLQRSAIEAILRRSQFSTKLSNLAAIYAKQSRVSFLKVFFDNAARQIKLEQFKENKLLTTMHQAFYVLSQYAAFKRQRHVRIATVLQAIHSAQAVNLAQSAFAAWKRIRFIAILKRNTVIRYANHLKFISLFALRKLLEYAAESLTAHINGYITTNFDIDFYFYSRMRKKKVIIEMREHHQKRLCLGEWKRLFLSGESTAPRHGRRQIDYEYSSLDSPIQQQQQQHHRYTEERFKEANTNFSQNQLRQVDSQQFYPSQYQSKYQPLHQLNQFGGIGGGSAYSSLDIAPGRSQMLKSLDSFNYHANNTFQNNYNSQTNNPIYQGYNSEHAQQQQQPLEDNTFVTENRISVTPNNNNRSQLPIQLPLQLQHHQHHHQQQQQPQYFQQSTSLLSDLSIGLGQNQLFSSIPIPPSSLIAQSNNLPQQQYVLPDYSSSSFRQQQQQQHPQFVSLLTPSINLSYDKPPNLPISSNNNNFDTNVGQNYISSLASHTNQLTVNQVSSNNKQNNYFSNNNNTISSSSNSHKNYASNNNLAIVGNQHNYAIGTVPAAGTTTTTSPTTSNMPTNTQGNNNNSNLHSIALASPYNNTNQYNSSSLNQSAAGGGVNRSLPYDQQLPISDRNPIITSAAFNEIPFRPASLPQISPRIPTFSETKDVLDIHGQQQEFEDLADDVNQHSSNSLPNSFSNSTGSQQRVFAAGSAAASVAEKKYQAFELENIEENNEENNSQSIVNKSQNEPSRKGSIHKSGKHGTNKSFEDYSNSKRQQYQDQQLYQQQQQDQQSYDYYTYFDPTLPVFSDKKQPAQQQSQRGSSLSQQQLFQQSTPQQKKAFGVAVSLDARNDNLMSGLESLDAAQEQRNLSSAKKPFSYVSNNIAYQHQEQQQQQ